MAPDGRVGEGLPLRSFEQFHQLVVDLAADQFDDLVDQVDVDRLGADEGLVGVGAPPVELLATGAPVAAFPLPQGGCDVAVLVGVVVETQG